VRICFEAVGELRTLDRALDEKFFAQLNTTRMSLIDATPLLPEASVETEDLAPAVVRAWRIYGACTFMHFVPPTIIGILHHLPGLENRRSRWI
jgi:hypothetical protein